jgi:hypothetical protein
MGKKARFNRLPWAVIAALTVVGTISCSLYGAWDILGFLSTKYLSRDEVIAADNWQQIQAYLNWLAGRGVSAPPSVDTSTIGGLGAGNKWYGGVLAPNGKIYCIPWDATDVLVIDPTTDTAVFPPGLSGLTGSGKWLGGVLAPNGKIYCIPWDATDVLVIDPTTDTAVFPPGLSGLTGSEKWHGSVLARNEKIYGIPCDAATVLVVDPSSDTCVEIPIPDPPGPPDPTDLNKWYGGVLAPNGKIYCIPWDSDFVMTIDPKTDTVIPDAIPFSAVATLKWVGGVLASNGKIYCIPREARRVLIIDPDQDAVELVSNLPVDVNKWAGGVLGPNGKIYGIPRDYSGVLLIDPAADTADPNGVALPPGPPVNPGDSNKWTGGVLAPNGKIYGIPNAASSVLILDVHSLGEMFASIAECAYFNKF